MTNSEAQTKILGLRKTIAWMDLVMANVNESILVVDDTWRIVFANSYLAEILDVDRILLLGQPFWDVLPMVTEASSTPHIKELPIKLIAGLNGVYDLRHKSIIRKLQLQGKYIKSLNQAVCILSDVTVELRAESTIMNLHKEVSRLKH